MHRRADVVAARGEIKHTILAQIVCRGVPDRPDFDLAARMRSAQHFHIRVLCGFAVFVVHMAGNHARALQAEQQLRHLLARLERERSAGLVGPVLPIALRDVAHTLNVHAVATRRDLLNRKMATCVADCDECMGTLLGLTHQGDAGFLERLARSGTNHHAGYRAKSFFCLGRLILARLARPRLLGQTQRCRKKE